MDELFNMLFRFGHILVGIAWIGLLYYFNFVQTEYFKEAELAALNFLNNQLGLVPTKKKSIEN